MTIKFIILGCGSSMGVPRADGHFGNCDPKNTMNHRTRCSALIKAHKKNILIDTSPDLRSQLLKNKVKNIDKVLYSHKHADQTHGINDLRIFYLKNKKKIEVYADTITEKYLKSNFKYCFSKTSDYPPILKLNKMPKILNFKIKGKKISIRTIPVKHGLIDSLSFIINNKCAYASDANYIYKKDLKFFKQMKFLIIDCLRYKEHPSHFNLNQIIDLVEYLKPKKTILTNLHSDMDYKVLKKKLPKNIIPAYDGLSLII
tara:strand:+ start:26 stop:799 length:774 start_codon:yes stop_codon:yes gene_type:complete